MTRFIKIKIQTPNQEQADIFMAGLTDIHFYAFEQDENNLVAYVKEADFDKEKLSEIIPENVWYEQSIIEDQNWNKQWESDFKPVIVGDFAAVRAAFHNAVEGVQHDLIITPKMSFGTGHHATTFIMIAQMEFIDFTNKSVFDFGTGTGVLAILAAKLGASEVMAIDLDEWSITNTLENIEANKAKNISVENRETIDTDKQYDIVLANINLNVLRAAASSLSIVIKEHGYLLTSGFLKSDEKEMQQIFERNNFIKISVQEKENWMSILFKKA